MNRIAVIAALPGELKPLVRGWSHRRRNGIDLWRQTIGRTEWVAACAGAGQEAAGRAFQEVRLTGAFAAVYSVGLAGALQPNLKAGSVHVVTGIIDSATGERFAGGARPPGALALSVCCLVTCPRVANHPEKLCLANEWAADLIDMEAAQIARLAIAHGIEFRCVKAVSDELTDRLPDLNRFIAPSGQFQLARFVGFAAWRPWLWPSLIRLGRNSSRAAQGLAEQLRPTLKSASALGTTRSTLGTSEYD